jgi:hypothetical protein
MFEYGVYLHESNEPHTELARHNSRRGKYPLAREFGYNGEPIRDIDFTDHGRPKSHLCPHQHNWKKNPAGGAKIRDVKAVPVDHWEY